MVNAPHIVQQVKCSNCWRVHEIPVTVIEGYEAGNVVTIGCGACGKTFDAILLGPSLTISRLPKRSEVAH